MIDSKGSNTASCHQQTVLSELLFQVSSLLKSQFPSYGPCSLFDGKISSYPFETTVISNLTSCIPTVSDTLTAIDSILPLLLRHSLFEKLLVVFE
jgi:hypothetical protein